VEEASRSIREHREQSGVELASEAGMRKKEKAARVAALVFIESGRILVLSPYYQNTKWSE